MTPPARRLLLLVALGPLAWLAAVANRRWRDDQAKLGRLSKRMGEAEGFRTKKSVVTACLHGVA